MSKFIDFDKLLVPVCNLVGVNLSVIDGKTVAGHIKKRINVGFFPVNSDVYVKSDFVDEYSVGMFVRIFKKLWIYIISDVDKGLIVAIFDGESAKLKRTEISSFKTGNRKLTLDKIKDSVKLTVKKFDGKWGSCEFSDMY